MSFWSRSWWVVAFCVIASALYFHGVAQKKEALYGLGQRLFAMEQEKRSALQKREDLHLRIASQTDPAWIEMILMRDLGVVPEGFLKVHFQK